MRVGRRDVGSAVTPQEPGLSEETRFLDTLSHGPGGRALGRGPTSTGHKPMIDRNPDDTWTSDALQRGDVAAVMRRVLEDPAYLASRDFVGQTPLLTAVGFGGLALVEFLVDRGADPDPDVDDGYTSL